MLLAACGGETPAEDGSAATGEVLEGTISDAMLPTDRVRSEAPLAKPEPTARSAGRGPESSADEADADADEADPEVAETEAPVIEPFVETPED